MISPIKGYSQSAFPTVSRVSPSLQPTVAGSFAPGLASPSGDQGLAQRGNQVVTGGGLSRSNLALLETMQAGMENSALLSSRMAPTAGMRQNDFPFPMRNQGKIVVANPQADLTRAGEIISATETGQPSIANSRIAQEAYLMEIQAESQIEQQSVGSNWMRQWFA